MMASFADDDRNSSADSDFFSPISASFFRPKSSANRGAGNATQIHRQQAEQQGSGEKLPPLHDSSWIGARLSPIGQSFDNESGDENDVDDGRFTSAYHRALHQSFENADFIVATERTRLLAYRPGAAPASLAAAGAAKRTGAPGHAFAGAGHSGLNKRNAKLDIHPLWNQPESTRNQNRSAKEDMQLSWGVVVCSIAGLSFVAMGFRDYHHLSRMEASGKVSSDESIAWSMPWIRPSGETMLAFGAFTPVLNWAYLWRSVASCFLCSSIVEYIAVLGAWRLISMIKTLHGHREPWHRWAGLYLASCFVGQLWMTAWDRTNSALTGCVAWSTCGVLTYIGVQSLSRRMVFFTMAAVLLALSLLQRPYSSVIGTVGACFLGWSLAAAEVTSLHSRTQRRPGNLNVESKPFWVCWLGRILAVKIVVLPTLFIAFLF